MRLLEAFNALLLAFAPTVAFPALRTLGFVQPSAEDIARVNWLPEDDVNAGANPYRAWMEARGLDARTVARRMSYGNRVEDIVEAWYVAKAIGLEPLPHKPMNTDEVVDHFESYFLGQDNWVSIKRSPADIVAFCKAVDITPFDLCAKDVPASVEIIEAAILYNRQISCGYDEVTHELLMECDRAETLGLETGGTGLLEMCEAIYFKAGHRPIVTDGSAGAEFDKIETMIVKAAEFVRASADATKPLPFAVYSSSTDVFEESPKNSCGEPIEKLPVFRLGEYGMGIVYPDTDKNQHRTACFSWLKALETWLSKPETGTFFKAVANARYIKSKNFGLKYEESPAFFRALAGVKYIKSQKIGLKF